MDSMLAPEMLFLVVDYLRRDQVLAPVATQLEALIAQHGKLGHGQRWDGTPYIRAYDDLIRKFPLAPTVLRNLLRDSANHSSPAWIGLAPSRLTPTDTVFRRIQNRSTHQRLRSCPPSLYGRYRHIKTIYGHHGPVFCVAFDRLGKRIITGSDDHRVKIWRTCDGALEYSLLGHTAPISDIAVSLCNIFVGSGSADGTVRLWYLRDGVLIRVLQLNSEITRIVFHQEYLICTAMDGCAHALLLCDAASHDVLTAPRPVESSCEALSVSISPCQQLFAVGYSNGHIGFFLVDLLSEGFMNPFSDVDISSAGEIVTAAFSTKCSDPDPLRIAVGSHCGKFHILCRNVNGLFDIQHALVHSEVNQASSTNLVVILAWAANDTRLVTSYHNSIHVWCANSGDLLFHNPIHTSGSDILSMSVHPLYSEALFTVSVDGSAIVSSLIDGSKIVKFPANDTYQLIDCSISPNGDFICATSDLGRLVLFGTGSRRRHAKLPNAQFFTFERPPLNQQNLSDLPPRLLCDAEFEVYQRQPRHLVQSYIARELSEAESDFDSDMSEDMQPAPPPMPYVEFDDISLDAHIGLSVAPMPSAVQRPVSEDEESFSMSSEENDDEDDMDEILSDEDLESFQIPVDMEIDPERRGPNTRRTRRHDSGSDSDRPLRRRHRRMQEAGSAPDATESAPSRRQRRRRRSRPVPVAVQIEPVTQVQSGARQRRQRRVERTASHSTVQSDRSASRNSTAIIAESIINRLRVRRSSAGAVHQGQGVVTVIPASPQSDRSANRNAPDRTAPAESIIARIRTRRSAAGAVHQSQNVAAAVMPASPQRRMSTRRRNVLSNQLANPVSPSRVRTRSSIPSAATSARVTRQSASSNIAVVFPGSPPATRRSTRVPYSDQPLRARRVRTELDVVGLYPPGSAYNTRTQAHMAAAAAAAAATTTSSVAAARITRRSQQLPATSDVILSSSRRLRYRSGSPAHRRTRSRSNSTDSDQPLRTSRRFRRSYDER